MKVFLKTPEKLSKKQKELFEQLDEEADTKQKRKNFFGKIMDKFSVF